MASLILLYQIYFWIPQIKIYYMQNYKIEILCFLQGINMHPNFQLMTCNVRLFQCLLPTSVQEFYCNWIPKFVISEYFLIMAKANEKNYRTKAINIRTCHSMKLINRWEREEVEQYACLICFCGSLLMLYIIIIFP